MGPKSPIFVRKNSLFSDNSLDPNDMKLQQLYTSCLAQGAYYLVSEGEAVVIDPLREVEPYTQRAEQDGALIKYVIETHFHADFVSGHLDLAAATGATVVFGPEAKPGYEAHIAKDGEVLRFGKLSLEVLHTPGHTPESTCYLLRDEEGQPHALFSGDTLFIGDVGRPDLAAGATATPQEMAATLYRSLRSKIMPLPDSVLVYPAHGAGSACGKNMSKETFDTLGHQKEVNYALNAQMTEEAFVEELTNGIAAPPAYFPHNVRMNKAGYEALDLVLARGVQPLGPVQFKTLAADPSVVILDTRSPSAYAHSHLPSSVFVGLDGQFAPWVGSIFPDIHQKFLLVVDEGREEEAVTRLARVGYHQALGYLQGGVAAWQQADFEVQKTRSVAAQDVPGLMAGGEYPILDARRPGEFNAGHLKQALLFPLDDVLTAQPPLEPTQKALVHCAGGYRSLILVSLLENKGYTNLVNIEGGYSALRSVEGLDHVAGISCSG
jgi:glyoxylase-like metal-dependent hydrolase (beta-lactamase superfamily II)/rhodanese-related sulfurtransferase